LINGILCIDKPSGISSMSAITYVKRTLHEKKTGHSGTLDPAASGLLVVAIGNAPRLFPFLNLEPKTYRFSIVFGTGTDTLDADGSIIEQGGSVPDEQAIRNALSGFTGEINQEPPRFSALKVNGQRAYNLARRQENFTLAPRLVTIKKLDMENFNTEKGEATFMLDCSSGTYVRSLARDIARHLGTFGHTGFIRRTGMAGFSVNDAVSPDCGAEAMRKAIRPLADVLSGEPRHTATTAQALALSHGMDISIDTNISKKFLFVFTADGELAAVTRQVAPGRFHPEKVFSAQ
jgi:tRNA pseudouridine55 synthase